MRSTRTGSPPHRRIVAERNRRKPAPPEPISWIVKASETRAVAPGAQSISTVCSSAAPGNRMRGSGRYSRRPPRAIVSLTESRLSNPELARCTAAAPGVVTCAAAFSPTSKRWLKRSSPCTAPLLVCTKTVSMWRGRESSANVRVSTNGQRKRRRSSAVRSPRRTKERSSWARGSSGLSVTRGKALRARSSRRRRPPPRRCGSW